MASKSEEHAAHWLRAVLAPLDDGSPIYQSEEFKNALVGLEWFIPEVLGEIHPEWNDESLDGILPAYARKIAAEELMVAGGCILISDQTVVPMHLRLKIGTSADQITWLECRLGERGDDGKMKRMPYDSWSAKKLMAAAEELDSIDWVYKVKFGER